MCCKFTIQVASKATSNKAKIDLASFLDLASCFRIESRKQPTLQ